MLGFAFAVIVLAILIAFLGPLILSYIAAGK